MRTLDAALLISSRLGADLGRMSDRLESDAFLGVRARLVLIEDSKAVAITILLTANIEACIINPILLGPSALQWELRHNLLITERLIHHTQWDSIHRSPEHSLN